MDGEASELVSLGVSMENTGDTFIKGSEGQVTLSNAEATPILTQPLTLGTFLTGTDLTYNKIGPEQRDSILHAGIALQKAGVSKADGDVKKALDDLGADNYVPVTN